MPQSLVKNYIHIVYSTKNRYPFIDKNIQDELYAYIGGMCNDLECYSKAIGGIEDHIHILCSLSQKVALMKLLEVTKSNSSRWMKTKGEVYEHFYWQNGYGAFSVNPRQIDRVIQYIQNQEQHHKQRTYKEEFRLFLNKYKVPYNEKYVWD